ncbi:MAG: PEP-CTERM sorting domain-containing protein [Planctomycetota bacterium]
MNSARKRRTKTIVDSTRWAGYLTAAAATALTGQFAEADIHVVDVNVELKDPYPGDMYWGYPFAATFGDPRVELQFWHHYSETGPGRGGLAAYGQVAYTAPASFRMSIAGFQAGAYYYPYDLQYGANISFQPEFIPAGARGDMAWGNGTYNSQWLNRDGYLAFRFDIGSGTQYGWAELTLLNGTPANIYQLERIAWSDPGESLFTGQVPEPGSLGLLSLGACGLLIWRRRRKPVP